MPKALWWPLGGGLFLTSEVTLYTGLRDPICAQCEYIQSKDRRNAHPLESCRQTACMCGLKIVRAGIEDCMAGRVLLKEERKFSQMEAAGTTPWGLDPEQTLEVEGGGLKVEG